MPFAANFHPDIERDVRDIMNNYDATRPGLGASFRSHFYETVDSILKMPRMHAPALLVIGVDGGRVQTQARDPETGSRWREDKVATITSYIPGDGKELKARPLVTTHVATMEKCCLLYTSPSPRD